MKYEWSEVFMSIEGEGPFTGHPTVYVRFAKCNFQCRGFNNPTNEDTTTIKSLGFNPKDYKDIYTIPLITKGCDSIYSWDPKFAHMWKKGDEIDLAREVLSVIPYGKFNGRVTGKSIILSITGGEPTLRAKTIPTLLNTSELSDVKYILIETNCSVPLKQSFIDELNMWIAKKEGRVVIWSNSPKLSLSGEKWEEAIRPDIAKMQTGVINHVQYFKFVCEPTEESFDEVAQAMTEYHSAGMFGDVYIMPAACTEEQQFGIAAKVAQMCIDRGYVYCHRVQNSVFGNGVGT